MKLSTSKIEKLMRINQYNKSVCQVEFLTATNDYTNVCNEYELALESAEKLTHWKSMTSRSGELDLELYSAALAFEHVAIAKLDEARDSNHCNCWMMQMKL
jgi:hypothetical protein